MGGKQFFVLDKIDAYIIHLDNKYRSTIMRLSTKSRYGLRALFDMAYNSGTLPVQIKDISRRQEISPRYLEQIFQSLKKAGILKSKRGPQGGYFLAKAPEQITVKAILEAAEGDTLLVDCLNERKSNKGACQFDASCVTQTVWQEATERLNEYLSQTTLKSLCEKGQAMGIKKEQDHRFTYYI
jgi:Rrf2 family protein